MDDLISRQAAIDAFSASFLATSEEGTKNAKEFIDHVLARIVELPSVQPEPLSDAYMKAVWTWLINYQIKASELKGKYSPCEVLSWVANDWRREHLG